MRIKVGTFNLNNLFSRWNFQASIDQLKDEGGQPLAVTYSFTEGEQEFQINTYRGKLVTPKETGEREKLAHRILSMDLDVLAVQEVEDIDTLTRFAVDDLEVGGSALYPYRMLVEGNDPRLIDVALLSRLPLGAVTSHRFATHPADPARPVFGRDLLEVEILSSSRKRRLLTVFVAHLKSHFLSPGEDPAAGEAQANERRRRQAEVTASIIEARTRPRTRYVLLGDMNDPPDSQWLTAFTGPGSGLGLVDGLANPTETRPAKAESTGPGPGSPAWTYRHKESGQPPQHLLYDQVWLSPSLAERQTGAGIDRRETHSGDGSDHDPAWVELNL